jgi:hypothetical protein
MSTEKRVNYTDEQVARIEALYAEFGTPGITTIVEKFNAEFPENVKNVKSIRGKLMTMKNDAGDIIYVPEEKAPKAVKDTGPTKKELLATLEAALKARGAVEFDVFKAFNGATKDAIEAVIALATPVEAAA